MSLLRKYNPTTGEWEVVISGGGSSEDTNNYLTGVSGSGNGTVTFTRQGLSSITWDSSHLHPYIPNTHAANGVTSALITNWSTAYTHSQSAHAPTNAQKNSDITKAEIEAKLTGDISTHSHSTYPTKAEVNDKTYLYSKTNNRDVNTIPDDYNNKFDIKGLKTNSVIGITGEGTFSGVLGMRAWGDSSGGNSHEFALTHNGNIYHRHGATTAWNAWKRLAFATELPSVFTGAVYGTSNGTSGLVPGPSEAQAKCFLRANGDWGLIDASDIPSLPIAKITDINNTFVQNKAVHQPSEGNITLIKTNMKADGARMFWIEIEGQDYSYNAGNAFLRASAYFYNLNQFINHGGIYSSNATWTLQAMVVDGYIALALSGVPNYNSLRIRVYSGYTETTYTDRVTSITNVTSLPTNSYLTSIALRKIILEGDTRLTNSRPASDVSAWAKAATKPSYTFSEIGSKPTSLSGYGIVLTKADIEAKLVGSVTSHTHTNHISGAYTLLDIIDGGDPDAANFYEIGVQSYNDFVFVVTANGDGKTNANSEMFYFNPVFFKYGTLPGISNSEIYCDGYWINLSWDTTQMYNSGVFKSIYVWAR